MCIHLAWLYFFWVVESVNINLISDEKEKLTVLES